MHSTLERKVGSLLDAALAGETGAVVWGWVLLSLLMSSPFLLFLLLLLLLLFLPLLFGVEYCWCW